MHWADVAYGLKFVALRYFNVAGAMPDGSIGEDHHPETHLIPIILQVAAGTHRLADFTVMITQPRWYQCARLCACC